MIRYPLITLMFFLIYFIDPGFVSFNHDGSCRAYEVGPIGDYDKTVIEATSLRYFKYSGFIEFETFINVGKGINLKDNNKKNEVRNRLQARYGSENLYLFSVTNLYLFQTYLNNGADNRYRYSKDQQISRNLRLSSGEAELSLDELYLNYGKGRFRLRAGNQFYAWGTADAFNPTSYFNPADMRELFFRDEDENKVGVPSLSGMFFLGDYTLETVLVPVHMAAIMAGEENFWGLSIDDALPLPVLFEEPELLGASMENMGYGARVSTTIGPVDISLSAYHGPDRTPLFLPYQIAYRGSSAVLEVRPKSYIVTMLGADLSVAMGDFVVQLEAVYSPGKVGVVEQITANLAGIALPFQTDRGHYISYTAGFNYFIPVSRLIEGHTGDALFTFEWFQSKYLESGIYSPPITDIVTCKLEDSYLEGRVRATIKGIFDAKKGGRVVWPEMEYDFQNGIVAVVGYAAISGERGASWEDNSIFCYFEDRDIVMAKIRYSY